MANQDIISRQEIEVVVNAFYDKVRKDDNLNVMFSDVNWQKHLPVMYDFWDNVLFYTGNYSGNPMAKHQIANERHKLTADHFNRWLELFSTTINELYSGPNAQLLKERAHSIAMIMRLKIIGHKVDSHHGLI